MDPSSLRTVLGRFARNHRWTWHHPTAELLDGLPGADDDRHPAATVAGLSDADLDALLTDDQFVATVRDLDADLDEATRSTRAGRIAYFSPEFGISERVPQYSGGLGVLAGDHLKASSDLDVPLLGMGLFYREGFFRQVVERGHQVERYERLVPELLGCEDTGVVVEVPLAGRTVAARVWTVAVGRIPLYLLDTDVDGNEPRDRAITDRLYGGDRRHRLEQELVLGVGGARALAALGRDPEVYHLNEGHAGFLTLELVDQAITAGLSLADAIDEVRPRLIFTTHTPVPAGIDRFDLDLVGSYLDHWAHRWHVERTDVEALGLDPADEPPSFNMAALCLRLAARANGVSELHGAVSRDLFASLGGSRIGAVTNGVHARTWVAPHIQGEFDAALGPAWADGDPDAWKAAGDLDEDTVRRLRRSGTEMLAALVAERLQATIDPDALVIGFARRFATYKRATLLLRNRVRLDALLADADRPVHFVFAGKAHPADTGGKALLADVVAFARSPHANGRFHFLADYEMAIARALYAGCDVWLNTPVRPHEASGTSGEKAALNGGLNCSILDGWWNEMFDGHNGWAIPTSDLVDEDDRDDAESTAAFDVIEHEIVPTYFAPGSAWADRVRHGWVSLGPRVTAARMLGDYCHQLYEPALLDHRR